METDSREAHPVKADTSIDLIPSGMSTVRNVTQRLNALFSMLAPLSGGAAARRRDSRS